MWRVVNDFWDYSAITDLPCVFKAVGTWQASAGLVRGHWPDADMLPLGYLGPRNEWHAQRRNDVHPERAGHDPVAVEHSAVAAHLRRQRAVADHRQHDGAVDARAADQRGGPGRQPGPLGTHAKRIAQQGSTEVWARDLIGGRKAVALFNRGTQDATVSATFAQLGVTGTQVVRDLWRRADVTGMTTGISVNVPYGGAAMYTLSPPDTGAGGAGGAPASSGNGGTPGTGGAAGRGASGGASGTGGSVGAGGATGTGGAATGAHPASPETAVRAARLPAPAARPAARAARSAAAGARLRGDSPEQRARPAKRPAAGAAARWGASDRPARARLC